MILKSFAAAVCITLASTYMVFAAPVNLDWEAGAASGTFYGLDDEDVTSFATSYDIFIDGAEWLNLSTTFAATNVFEFNAGMLTDAYFIADPNEPDTAGTDTLLSFSYFVDAASWFLASGASGSGNIQFSLTPVSAVPLPAGGLLLLTGFGAIAALKRRKKRAA